MKISTADKILCQSPSTLKEQQSGICFLHMEAEKTAVHRLDTLIHGELAKFLWGLFLDYFKNLSVVLKQNLRIIFQSQGRRQWDWSFCALFWSVGTREEILI